MEDAAASGGLAGLGGGSAARRRSIVGAVARMQRALATQGPLGANVRVPLSDCIGRGARVLGKELLRVVASDVDVPALALMSEIVPVDRVGFPAPD